MVTFFPNTISRRGIVLYIISLAVVSIVFHSYAMDFIWIAFGILGILLFFMLSTQFTVK